MTHECTRCFTNTSIPIDVNWEGFVCKKCSGVYERANGELKRVSVIEKQRSDKTLGIGEQGNIENDWWTVISYTELKDTKRNMWWGKYRLQNAYGSVRYLRVNRGYWYWDEEVDEQKEKFLKGESVEATETTYQLYFKSNMELVYAEGFFEKPIPANPIKIREYIAPPLDVLIEIDGENVVQFRSRRVKTKELRAAFPEAKLPERNGADKLSPSFSSLLESWGILSLTSILMILLFVWGERQKTDLTGSAVLLAPGQDTVVLSQTFELNLSAQIVNVEIAGNLSNTWLEADIGLTNVENGEEHIARSEISYYSGLDNEGYPWEEGAKKSLVKFCGIKQGKYILATHLFLPSEANEKAEAKWRVFTDNQMDGLLFWGLTFVVLFFFVALFMEMARWRHSPHTPYFEELTGKDIQQMDKFILSGQERNRNGFDFFT